MSKHPKIVPWQPKLLAAAIALATPLMSAQLSAQDAYALEEIVVTAQKREQSVQDIPSTVSAVGGEALQDMKLVDFEDLEQMAAGLDIRRVSGRNGSVALRGVDFNPNSGTSPAVDIYWNDTTLGINASGGIFQQLFDLDRIEVLRGPQGTLQGRTSPAGALSIHTAKADMSETGGYIRTNFTNHSGNNTQAAANLVLIPDQLAIRFAVGYDDNEGLGVENVIDGQTSNDQSTAGRFSLAWAPTESLGVDLSYQYMETDSDFYFTLVGSSALGQDLPELSFSDRKSIHNDPSRTTGTYEYLTFNVDWEIGNHQLVFNSGYSELASLRSFDLARGNSQIGFSPNPLTRGLDSRIGVSGSQLNDPQTQLDRNYTSSQELRFASIDNDFWNYTVGVFRSHESGSFKAGAVTEQRLGGAVPVPNSSIYFGRESRTPYETDSIGVFVHNIFDFSEQWTGQFGLRWQEQDNFRETTVHITEDVLLGGPLTFRTGDQIRAGLIPANLQQDSYDSVTGSASIQYDFIDQDIVGYASMGTSYRPGGVIVSATNLGEFTSFGEEDSWFMEAGFKGNFMDDTLRLNAAVFYQEYDNYIGRTSRILGRDQGNQRLREVNLTTNGDAEVQGIEFDAELLLSENWYMAGAVSYTEAEYKDGVTLPCNTGTPPAAGTFTQTCEVGGLELGTQPRLSASIRSEYTVPFEATEAYVRGLFKFTGNRSDLDASDDLGGYGTLDLHFGLREQSAVWEVSLYALNVFDKQTIDNLAAPHRTYTRVPTGYSLVEIIPERTIGLSASYAF